jgi:hypothetical protein
MSAEVEITPAPVVFTQVPVVGDHVWFVSEEEMLEGMWIEGEVVEVTLSSVRILATNTTADDFWTMPLADPKFPIYFSYVDFLEAQVEILNTQNHKYFARFGAI